MKQLNEKKKYPLLSVRISEEQREQLRRQAESMGCKVPDYVRTILFPFESPSIK